MRDVRTLTDAELDLVAAGLSINVGGGGTTGNGGAANVSLNNSTFGNGATVIGGVGGNSGDANGGNNNRIVLAINKRPAKRCVPKPPCPPVAE